MKKIFVNKYVVADPTICHGKPTFVGTRIMVWQILEMLAAGETEESILKAFPSLEKQHVKAALGYASSITRESYVIINTQNAISPR